MKNKRKQLGSTGKKQVEVLKIKTFQIKNHRQQTILPHQEKWEIKNELRNIGEQEQNIDRKNALQRIQNYA